MVTGWGGVGWFLDFLENKLEISGFVQFLFLVVDFVK